MHIAFPTLYFICVADSTLFTFHFSVFTFNLSPFSFHLSVSLLQYSVVLQEFAHLCPVHYGATSTVDKGYWAS